MRAMKFQELRLREDPGETTTCCKTMDKGSTGIAAEPWEGLIHELWIDHL